MHLYTGPVEMWTYDNYLTYVQIPTGCFIIEMKYLMDEILFASKLFSNLNEFNFKVE